MALYSCLISQTRTPLHITLNCKENWRSIIICTLGYQFWTLQKMNKSLLSEVLNLWQTPLMSDKSGSRNTKGCYGTPQSRKQSDFARGQNTISHKNHHRLHLLYQHSQILKRTAKFHAIYPITILTTNSASRWIKELLVLLQHCL